MSRQFITTGSVWEREAGYSRAVVDGRDVFVSGTVGFDRTTGAFADTAAAQAETAIDTIEWALREAGVGLADVVRVRVFVPDRADVGAVSAVIARRIGPSRAANTTVCAPLPVAEAKVEIEVTARRPAAAVKPCTPWGGMLHEVVEHDGTLYLSGIVSEDLSLDMAGQAEDCMRQLETVLKAHGSDLNHVLQATIFIADLAVKPAFDAVWKRRFAPGRLPARAGIGVADLGPRVLVEIVVIAAKT